MIITIKRIAEDNTSTIGTVAVDGQVCAFCLEDAYRRVKVAGLTRIPAGRFAVVADLPSRFDERYKKFYPQHQGMLRLQAVPNFTGVLIHRGNTHIDTQGCLLIGMGANITPNNMTIMNSAQGYLRLYQLCIHSALAKGLFIEIYDYR